MNAGRSLISSYPPLLSKPSSPSSYLKDPTTNSCSVPIQHENRRRAVTFASSIMCQFPSFISEEQFADHKDDYSLTGIEVMLATLRQLQLAKEKSVDEQTEKYGFDRYMKDFKRQLLCQPMLWSIPPCTEEPNSIIPAKFAAYRSNTIKEFKETLIMEEKIIRSRRLLDRRSKKRKASGHVLHGVANLQKKDRVPILKKEDVIKKIRRHFDSNDLYSSFFRCPEKKLLLTTDEEKDLFMHIQDLLRLEEVKERLQTEFDREPTLGEWSQSAGMSCQALQSCLYSGQQSREKIMHSHMGLVVHVAKRYKGNGLHIHDLRQEGSLGLLVSLDKFKPKMGCRFATYAFWWVRQSIRKAIFSNSRIIRLPEHVHALLKKVNDIRRQCIFEEGHKPSNEEIARRLGISAQKLAKILLLSRKPRSIQESTWLDSDVTLQETTADPVVEVPELSVSKTMMRHRVHEFLRTLDSRDRIIIQERFGFHDGRKRSLEEIGNMFGITKERVRQLEARAFNKLKEFLHTEEVQLYKELLL